MHNKDVKFIIYQSLYILVICIIAIKGADINLEEVELKKLMSPGYAYIDTTDKVQVKRDELSKMINFDSTKFMIVSIADYNKHPEMYTPVSMSSLNVQSPPENIITTKTQEPVIDKETPKSEIVLGEMSFYQYHLNQVNNKGNSDISINGITIPAHSIGSVLLKGDKTVTVSTNGATKTYSVIDYKKPQIHIERKTTMGDDTKLTELQRVVCFRVTVDAQFPEQLDGKFGGPVTVKQSGTNTWDVTLNAFHDKSAFDRWTEDKQSPYSLGFTVTISDKVAPFTQTAQQSFIFGEW